jgi:hypothetical protein
MIAGHFVDTDLESIRMTMEHVLEVMWCEGGMPFVALLGVMYIPRLLNC